MRPCAWLFVMCGPQRGMGSWQRGLDAHRRPCVDSGHQIRGHSRWWCHTQPDICPQSSLAGLFTIGHPKGDKKVNKNELCVA